VPRAAWHWGGDGSVVSCPLGTPGGTPWYLCYLPVRGSVGSDHYFPIMCGTYKEMTSKKKQLKHRDFVVHRHL
jgi:hypothetical protein